MKYAICVAKNGGYMFGGRRVSSDASVREKLIELAGEHCLCMSAYSAAQFYDHPCISICDSFSDVSDEHICFIEDGRVNIARATEIYLFHWNREYPANRFFKFDPERDGFERIKKEEFKGNSHEKITLEIFRRI